jgi:HTH-type transcriptional regulator/antitoxin HigA
VLTLEQFRTPGQYIQNLLEERGWTQRVLAIVLGVDETGLNKIITGKRPLDAGLSLSLSAIFDVPAETFLQLQKDYDLALARLVARPDPALADRARLFGGLPITEMVKRGWLPGVMDIKNVAELERAIHTFFGASSADEIHRVGHAAKKTDQDSPASVTQIAWLHRVRQIAREMIVAKFTKHSAVEAITALQQLLGNAEGVRKVPRILSDSGIRFVVVEALPGAKIDGVCSWLDDNSPVIGMSLRFDRIDNFWFVLRHEIEHVIRGHGKEFAIIDAELEGDKAGVGGEVPEEERIANHAAAQFCLDQAALARFVAKKTPYFAERDIIGFARTMHVHPGLVAGQLQRQLGRYDKFRDHLVKIRSIILPNVTSDGWGNVAPLEL